MEKYTPGPWEIHGGEPQAGYVTHIYAPNAGEGNGGLIARLENQAPEADARLISAAPCLLELLEKLCFDRGVILHATVVDDSRESFRALCEKHGIEVEGLISGWQDGKTFVLPKKPEDG